MVNHATTTNRAPGARPAATFSTVQIAHLDLVTRLAATRPHQIVAIADRHDVQERAEHVRDVLSTVLAYIGTVVSDTKTIYRPGCSTAPTSWVAFPSSPATSRAACSARPTTSRRGGRDHVRAHRQTPPVV
jgi:hypothetical protein